MVYNVQCDGRRTVWSEGCYKVIGSEMESSRGVTLYLSEGIMEMFKQMYKVPIMESEFQACLELTPNEQMPVRDDSLPPDHLFGWLESLDSIVSVEKALFAKPALDHAL